MRQALAATSHTPSGPLLFRVTEAQNLPAVLAHGTDRALRPEGDLGWRENGYTGAERRWSEVIFASTEDEVRRRLAGLDEDRPCALDKLAGHEGAHVLVYDAGAMERVRDKEYAARAGTSLLAALRLVLRASDGGVVLRCTTRPPTCYHERDGPDRRAQGEDPRRRG